jgi:TPR repeat protein
MSCAIWTRAAGQLALVALLGSSVSAATPPQPPGASIEQAVSPKEAERRGLESWRKGDDAAALRWLQQAADAGLPMSQFALARHYMEGVGVRKDTERGMQLLRAAADRGVANAQALLGFWYLAGSGVKADPALALQLLTAAAKQEDPLALRELARLYERGYGVKRDTQRARRLMLRAAQLADPDAVRYAAGLLLRGPKEGRDAALGMHLLQKSANAKDPQAAYRLGREYLDGVNVPRDPARAAQWLAQGSEAGFVPATLWLSELHFKGIGVAHDRARAEEILTSALATATMSNRNNFAWDLAVAQDERLRDGELAARVLEEALTSAAEKSPGHIDTLAAVYAELGQFDKAVKTQLSAIDRLRRAGAAADEIDDMQQRLALYQQGKPYREEWR